MPLIDNQMRGPAGPRSNRPHLILVTGLLLLLLAATLIGAWS